ncbi:hypothetical protein SCLCIDRAFT_21998 [Scleroderma citrinum Foug A]|uniref:Cyanovirin-N domain-containing protein n=1 Tax=Scleroderma citrinum Foug A TaxID=1036808 RepID=A0A0C3ANL5_9AGAM|nr:hypothetical protein SCLCIDRAFT_21998 [Scleroderma citrinum Foug A]
MRFFSISVSLILAALSTHCAAQKSPPTCLDASLKGHILSATCQRNDPNRTQVKTTLDMNKCFAYNPNNKKLQCGKGYTNSCTKCELDASDFLDCECGEDHHQTSINPLDCVKLNDDGTLACKQ